MEMNDQATPESPPSGNAKTFAIISLVLGVINLCAWFFPICGFPLGLVGLVLGYLGLKAPEQKNLAIAGMVLSGIGLLLACVNAIAGVVFAPQIEQIFNEVLQGIEGY